ncbi:MAG: PorP/SprF family type IX secretion system membrane protein [Sphingobacteriales bacterium]|jgi:type IX secretion system PorP/SprF family membrane protein|nr:PorP/SprF family type IX secretion system membrane protein [Sphingobacteriales bacterium]
MIKRLLPVLCICLSLTVFGQDPHFSQFFTAPHAINPANTGTSQGAWRVLTNVRQQWANSGTRFNSYSLTSDVKLLGSAPQENTLALGLSFLADRTMNGAFSSTYTSTSLAYHVQVNTYQRLGMGLQASYGTRQLDFSRLTFGEQFVGENFDTSLPSGETSLSALKPFISLSAGLFYNFQTDELDLDMGAALFHLNKPKQSFISNSEQLLPAKQSVHLSATYGPSAQLSYHMSAIYQKQSNQQYFSVGGAAGIQLANSDNNRMLWAGMWYRNNDAIYPYLGILNGNMQLGISYDLSVSKQVQNSSLPGSFELSLIFRQSSKRFQSIVCPWR